jgi:hypothetical protein
MAGIEQIISAQISKNDAFGTKSLEIITNQLVKNLNDQKTSQAIDFEHNPEYVRANKKIIRLQNFKDQISDTVSAATKAKNAAGFIEVNLDNMKLKLEAILSSTSDVDRASVAEQYNQLYTDINSRADNANQIINHRVFNLISNTSGPEWKTTNLSTPMNQTGGFITIEGSFLGTDHEIIDADGYAWRLDKSMDLYKQYINDGSETSTGSQISATNMVINHFDSSAGSFSSTDTQNLSKRDAITLSNGVNIISGTLNRGGLEILSSEYYSDFADDISVQNAISDIEKAIIYFDINAARMSANTSLLQSNNFMIKEQIASLQKETAAIVTEEVRESSVKSRAADLKFAFALNDLRILTDSSHGLLQNMLMGAQQDTKASGLFGMLGY